MIVGRVKLEEAAAAVENSKSWKRGDDRTNHSNTGGGVR